jgi:hypothetical protein
MEAISSSETSVNARTAQRHIPEDDILHSHIKTASFLNMTTNGQVVNYKCFGGTCSVPPKY